MVLPPVGEDFPAEYYRDITIMFSWADGAYYLQYQAQLFRNFNSIDSAKAFIDVLLAPPPTPPPEEPPPTPPEPSEVSPPWPFSWLQGLLTWFGRLWGGLVDGLSSGLKPIADGLSGFSTTLGNLERGGALWADKVAARIEGTPGALWDGLVDKLADLFKRSADESIVQALLAVGEATGHSLEWKRDLDAKLEPFGVGIVSETLKGLSPEAIGKSPLTAEEAAAAAQNMMLTLTGIGIGTWLANAAAESATLGQLEAVGRIEEMVLSKLGLSQLGAKALMLPLDELVFKRAQQHWASQFTPEIPATTDLISMVVKEVITIDSFKKWMRFKGFGEEWSQAIWDAHFIAPTLTDLLTAWRRGLIDEAELDRLMILVDLDPRYKNIFDTRKYITPSLSLTRFLWETGAIGRDEVERNVKLEGYHPDHVPAIVSFICEFQERLWRRRYLVTLSGGYQKGVFTSGELEKAVVDAGYTPDVAKWIIANADARKKIAEAKVAVEKPKLLGIGDLKRAYLTELITRDALITELNMRAYPTDQVTMLVALLDQEKVVESAGGAKVALSQAELVNAWRYGEITEDQIMTELQLRGLSLDETNILIRTKKKQWGVGGIEGP